MSWFFYNVGYNLILQKCEQLRQLENVTVKNQQFQTGKYFYANI